jgi:hypothetical protein
LIHRDVSQLVQHAKTNLHLTQYSNTKGRDKNGGYKMS